MWRILPVILLTSALVASAQNREPADQELIKQLTISNVDVMHGLTFEIYVCKLLESQG